MASRFACDVCFKTFKNNQALRRHYIVHTKSKPYACMYCSKRFGRDDTYNRYVIVCELQMGQQWWYHANNFTLNNFPNLITNPIEHLIDNNNNNNNNNNNINFNQYNNNNNNNNNSNNNNNNNNTYNNNNNNNENIINDDIDALLSIDTVLNNFNNIDVDKYDFDLSQLTRYIEDRDNNISENLNEEVQIDNNSNNFNDLNFDEQELNNVVGGQTTSFDEILNLLDESDGGDNDFMEDQHNDASDFLIF